MTVEERGFTRISEDVKATIWAATHRLGQMRRLLMHEKHKAWKREFGFDRIETAAKMDEKRSRTTTILKTTVEERGLTRMSEDVKATIWAATHRLGKMRCLLMHEKNKAWKREFGFDRIETAAKMDEKCSRTSTSPVPNPFFYRNMVISRHPHTPEEFNLEMKVDVKGLRMEIIISQPASPECDPSPRCATVGTGSEEPGTPQQPPGIGTGSEEPGASRAQTQIMEEEGTFPFETSMDGFLCSTCTSLEQKYLLIQSREEYILLQVQPEVGMDDSNATTPHTAARKVSARLPIVQQQGMTAWSTDQNRQFDRGKSL